MDWEKIGKFIAQLRNEKGMTQAELSKHLYTSRENISKWERGVNRPTTETLIELSEIFEVSVTELLAGERKTNNNKENFDKIPLKILKDADVKVKRTLIRSLIIIVGLLLIFFIYYFINTYNTIYVYLVAGSSDNFISKDGIALFSKNKSYIKLGEIKSLDGQEYDSLEIYFYDKDKNKQVIYNSEDTDLMVISSYLNNEYFSYNNMKEIVKNSYLVVKYGDKEETIKLNFERDMHNSFRIFNKDRNVIKEDEETENNDVTKEKLKDKFKYDKETNLYSYKGKTDEYEYEIEYSEVMGTFTVHEYRKDEVFTMNFNRYTNIINVMLEATDKSVKMLETYNNKTKECYTDKCDLEQVKYFFDNYYNKYSLDD